METSELPYMLVDNIKFIKFQDMINKYGKKILQSWYSFARDSSYFVYYDSENNISLGILYDEYCEFIKTI